MLTSAEEQVNYNLAALIEYMAQSPRTIPTEEELEVSISNIGGIENRTVTIPPGVTVLTGENATNRTSFLEALMTVVGLDVAYPKGDAKEGTITMTIGDDAYERTVRQVGGDLEDRSYTGTPFLTDDDAVTAAKHFAALLGNNPVRQAIEHNGDLYNLLMEPVDDERIQSEIDQINAELEEKKAKRQEAREAGRDVQKLEQRRAELRADIEELEEEKKTLKEQVNELEEEHDDELREERRQVRDERDSVQDDLNKLKSRIERLEAQRDSHKADLKALDHPDADVDGLASKKDDYKRKLNELRTTRTRLTDAKDDIAEKIRLAQELTDGNHQISRIFRDVDDDVELPDGPLATTESTESVGDLTEQISRGESIRCGVCGSETHTETSERLVEQYEAAEEHLKAKISDKDAEISQLEDKISDIESTLAEVEDANREETRIRGKLDDAQTRLEDAREDVPDLESRLEDLNEELDGLEPTDVSEELSDARDKLNNIRSQKSKKEGTLSNVTDRLERKEELASQETEYDQRVETLRDQLQELRGEVDRIEDSLVKRFNDQMDDVLDLLDYENVARVWIDKKKPGDETVFDLNIVREGERGTYNTPLATLSESERNVVGLTVALAGYLVHEVYEECPIIAFDSIEMIDSNRIDTLLEYFSNESNYIVAALLPEDATSVNAADTTIDW